MELRKWEMRRVPLGLLDDNPVYPHQRLEPFEDQPDDGGDTRVGSLEELQAIIRESRLLIALSVVQVGDRYTILNGHRRLRVARSLGLDAVDCTVLTLGPGESVEVLFVQVQTQADADLPWPWSEVQE